jgi:hypothetical protein
MAGLVFRLSVANNIFLLSFNIPLFNTICTFNYAAVFTSRYYSLIQIVYVMTCNWSRMSFQVYFT